MSEYRQICMYVNMFVYACFPNKGIKKRKIGKGKLSFLLFIN